MLLALLYPGHNSLQTLTIRPGPVISFAPDLLPLADYPLGDDTPPPYTSAASVIIQDVTSHTIIYSYQQDATLLPASTTKLMTALVALDYYDLSDVLVVKSEDQAIGSSMHLVAGESITVQNLLYGLLIGSGNDAALALADNFPGGYQGFVEEMNRRAEYLHLDNTSYRNPSGIESYNHYTTARDLATLASHALTSDTLREIVNTTDYLATDTTGELTHSLTNTNELLGKLAGVEGMKTGWTENAGECLVTYVEREGRGVIIAVLGSLDRFGDTENLVNWVYSHFNWVKPS